MGTFTCVEEYLASLTGPLAEAGEKTRPVIDAVLPGAGAIWHGHPVWSLGATAGKTPVCLLKAYPSYLTFGLWRGREISDPSGRLDTRKGMAHVRLRTTADVDAELFTDWLRQARDLEPFAGRAERTR
jgi:hypothetical protein